MMQIFPDLRPYTGSTGYGARPGMNLRFESQHSLGHRDEHWSNCMELVQMLNLFGSVSDLGFSVGGYQNYGPLLGPLKTWCLIILRTQKES